MRIYNRWRVVFIKTQTVVVYLFKTKMTTCFVSQALMGTAGINNILPWIDDFASVTIGSRKKPSDKRTHATLHPNMTCSTVCACEWLCVN